MLRAFAICTVGLLLGCKGKSATTAGGSAAGSGSAAVSAGGGRPVDAVPSARAGLAIDDRVDDVGLLAAFDKQVPLLPAISADGATLATLHSGALGLPMPVEPWSIAFRQLASGKEDHFEIVGDDMIESAQLDDDQTWKNVPVETLRERGARARQKLAGYSSLTRIELALDERKRRATRIDSFTLKNEEQEDRLAMTVVDGSGRTVHRETVKAFVEGEWDSGMGMEPCNYRPRLSDAYQDAQKRHLYVVIGRDFPELCPPLDEQWLVFDLPAPRAADAAAAADLEAATKLFAGELDALHEKDAPFTSDAQIFSQNGLATRDQPGIDVDKSDVRWGGHALHWTGHDDHDVEVTLAADRTSAWATGIAAVTLSTDNANHRVFVHRVSSVLVKTQAGWRIAATMISEPVANATVNAGAKAGNWKHATFAGAAGDAAVQAAFDDLVANGLDQAAAASPDLVAIGSADGERTVGGGPLAKAWSAAWKGKAKVTSRIAGLAPSGTTGWVGATLELPKKGYNVPFYVFCVFDKAASGAWTLVHMHLAV